MLVFYDRSRKPPIWPRRWDCMRIMITEYVHILCLGLVLATSCVSVLLTAVSGHVVSCFPEFWRHSSRSRQTLRRSQIRGHDDGQGDLRPTRFPCWATTFCFRTSTLCGFTKTHSSTFAMLLVPTTTTTKKYDIYFQDDGGHSIRYAPYSGQFGLLLCPSQRADAALSHLLAHGGRFDS